MASVTGAPDPSWMMPSMMMRSPCVPALARMSKRSSLRVLSPAEAGRVPIWTNGPAVCEGVSFNGDRGMSAALRPVFEEGGMPAAQHDVEAVDQAVERHHVVHVELGGELVDGARITHRVDDRTARNERIALEIELGHQSLHEGMSEERKMDMGRPPVGAVVAPRIGAGLDGAEG